MLVTQHFLLFLPCFLSFLKQISIFLVTNIFSSANVFNLDQSENLSFGKELRRILFSLVVIMLAFHQGNEALNPARYLYFFHAFVMNFFVSDIVCKMRAHQGLAI